MGTLGGDKRVNEAFRLAARRIQGNVKKMAAAICACNPVTLSCNYCYILFTKKAIIVK